ncbi:Splicing factor [Mortierella polycephala]|uniref:Splicing factor n=1 Tax=Mortierella polycephala TaxID=41804 RepID=A0A9P6U9I8_9FUNG|nr:Splicing factor [Mortierella polycephala]
MNNKDGLSESEDDFGMDVLDNSEDGPSPEILEAIATLKTSLKANPNQYEQHTQLIVLLKDAAMLEQLRDAREAMNTIYPLSEELWMDWIGDESNMAASEEEKKHVLELYERATSDYLSINIWKSYVEYATQEYIESAGLEASEIVVSKDHLRRIFQKADKYVGYHIPQSHVIWNAWMDFELQQLDAQKPTPPEDIGRVKAMYLGRIAIPHADQENTFSSLSSFISQYDNQDYEASMIQNNKIMSNTRKLLTEREKFEESLVSTGNSLEAFTSYLEFELRPERRHFQRTRTLFERALAVHCLIPSIWNDYVTFILSSNPHKKEFDLDPSEVLVVAQRSIRNCPWSGDLWENRFLLMEMYSKPEGQINAIFAGALTDLTLLANPQELSKVLVARCTYKFRKAARDEDGHNQVREAFQHALTVIEAAGGDPYCKLERLWIDIESNTLGDHEKARKLRLDNAKGARQIFVRACNAAKHLDWPERVFEAWLMFEREQGTVINYKDALTRSRNAMKAVEAIRAKQAESAYMTQPAAYDVVQPAAYDAAQSVASVVAMENEHMQSETQPEKASAKKRKGSFQSGEHAAKVTKTDGTTSKQSKMQERTIPPDISRGRHEDTCFVTNFPSTMTEKMMRELFQEFGTIRRCTIPARGGKKTGIAYVQFTGPEEAHAALALDGRDVGERRGLSVKISDTTQASHGAGGAPLPKESRHELHVTGIANDVKQDELRKLVALFAEPLEVFVMRPKGPDIEPWANIKFSTEQDANAALALNGTAFQGKPLVVTRRVFKNARADASTEGLSRKERRKQAAEARLKEGESHEQPGQKKAETKDNDDKDQDKNMGTGKHDRSEGPSKDKASSKKTDTTKPAATLTSMQPRHVQARPAFQRRPRTHQIPPKRAFIHASDAGTGEVSAVVQAGSEAPAPAPKSNADFRALMLSGALRSKKT